MRAIRVDRFGDPRVLVPVELPDPVAGSGQAVVEVAAVDTLFVETQIRSGAFAEPFGVRPPYVPGGAVTGRVRTVGPGVTGDRQGRTVAAVGISGGYAEQVAVPAEALIPVPDGVDPQRAAALLHDGPTALGLFDAAAVQPGRWVLVMAAAGGAGILLVQLARAAGARVSASSTWPWSTAPRRRWTTPSPAGASTWRRPSAAKAWTWSSTAPAARWARKRSR